MTLEEVPRFVAHLQWLEHEGLVSPDDLVALCRALRSRVAAIMSAVEVRSLFSSCEILSLLSSAGERFHGNGTPRRSLEARLGYLAYHPPSDGRGTELEALVMCYQSADDLVGREIATEVSTSRPKKIAADRMVRWLTRASDDEILDHAPTIRMMAASESALFEAIAERLQKQLPHAFRPGRLPAYVKLLLDFCERGLTH